MFLDELVRTRRCGKNEAARVLGLLTTNHREDLARALVVCVTQIDLYRESAEHV